VLPVHMERKGDREYNLRSTVSAGYVRNQDVV